MLTKRREKKLDENCIRILWAILKKSWKQHPSKQQLYGHQTPIFTAIQIRWTRHAEHSWGSKNEIVSDVLLWIPAHRFASVGRPTRPYLQQLCMDTGCSLEDLPEAMNDQDEKRERERERVCGKSVRAAWHDDEDIYNLVWFLCLMAYQLFVGYLMPKPSS